MARSATVLKTCILTTVVNNFVYSKDMTKLVRTPIIFEEEDIPNKESITTFGNSFCSGASIHKFKGWENLSKFDEIGFHVNLILTIVDLSKTNITILPKFAFHNLLKIERSFSNSRNYQIDFLSIYTNRIQKLFIKCNINMIRYGHYHINFALY